MLDIEKIESGKIEFDIKSHSLTEIIKTGVMLTVPYGEKFNVKFEVDDPLFETDVYVDFNRVLQVISNLLSNAAKYSPQNSVVRISTEDIGGYARILVTDNGPGIPENFKNQIFCRFAQSENAKNKNVAGTGLGLNIAKNIVEHLGGNISFHNNKDKGTTFYFDLPKITKSKKVTLDQDC